MANQTTIGDLFKAKAITDEQVSAAVDAFLAGPASEPFPIADGYRVDLAAAVAAHAFTTMMVGRDDVSTASKRGAVRTAILLARPA